MTAADILTTHLTLARRNLLAWKGNNPSAPAVALIQQQITDGEAALVSGDETAMNAVVKRIEAGL